MRTLLKYMLHPPARYFFKGLAWLEKSVSTKYTLQYNPTFIIAPPRSGSTLLYQLITYALATSYFTYLTGRLKIVDSPALPVLSAKLSTALKLHHHHQETFENTYGAGQGWGGPAAHEVFNAWFPDEYTPAGNLSIEKQTEIYQAVAATEQIFKHPFVDKEQKHANRIAALLEIFPDALFIQCHRDPLDIAQSIFLARTQDFNPEDWFSAKPKNYANLKKKSIIEQVCAQVYFLEQDIAADRGKAHPEQFYDVSYHHLCQNPADELQKIASFMTRHGAPTEIVQDIPSIFPFSSGCKLDKGTYLALADHLESLYGQPMKVDKS